MNRVKALVVEGLPRDIVTVEEITESFAAFRVPGSGDPFGAKGAGGTKGAGGAGGGREGAGGAGGAEGAGGAAASSTAAADGYNNGNRFTAAKVPFIDPRQRGFVDSGRLVRALRQRFYVVMRKKELRMIIEEMRNTLRASDMGAIGAQTFTYKEFKV